MSGENSITIPAEPEEAIEAALVSILAECATVPVVGMLASAPQGTVKSLDEDTFIGVKADQTSQDGDYTHRAPVTMSATVTVHYSLADDADGAGFREECRRVRRALIALTGDGCAALDAEGEFDCDAFMLDATSTDFSGGDNPVRTKAYTATVKGRIINQNTEA